MKKLVAAAVMLSVAACLPGAAGAQSPDLLTPQPNILPPPLPPPPPPKIEVPKVPRMGDVPSAPRAAVPKRRSFNDRVRNCIEEGAAMGLGPNDRAAYSRSCANR